MPSKPTRKDAPASLDEEPMRKGPSARGCSCNSSQFSSGWRRHSDDFRQILQRRCRSEEHTSELQSLMRISYAVFCLKKKQIQTVQIMRILQKVRMYDNFDRISLTIRTLTELNYM